MKNYSRQREAILSVLRSTNCHPTANWVYDKAREIIPNISLGTVYRNLSELSRAGEILCISVNDGVEHYDGNNKAHIHLHCKCCGKIDDVMLENDLLAEAAKLNGFAPERSVYVVYGVCKDCNAESEKLN